MKFSEVAVTGMAGASQTEEMWGCAREGGDAEEDGDRTTARIMEEGEEVEQEEEEDQFEGGEGRRM